MADKTYLQRAKRKWRHAEWISGNGRFALLAHCKVLTVKLYQTYTEAVEAKKFIDQSGCGGGCYKYHEIIVLNKMAKKVSLF